MSLRRTFTLVVAPICLLVSGPLPVEAQFSQQVAKLVGAGAVGANVQGGYSVSLSADGNTALVGGPADNGLSGAAWVWTRSGDAWTPQGPKLVGSGAVGAGVQGVSVSLSADGNTALVGAPFDNANTGAAWVWTRNGGVWAQQGPKLVGTGSVGFGSQQGRSVSLSADGNTALIGGNGDNSNTGAVWVWTRSGGVWTQGPKLVGAGAVGKAQQGYAVSLSADGNSALVGGYTDNSTTGAAWVWTRNGGAWAQQGGKLVGAGAAAGAAHGFSVSLSADGNTAVVGGFGDNGNVGAAWVWTRSGGVWTQQGPTLVGTGAVGSAQQGFSVSLSADGNTALVSGRADNSNLGAAWVWTRSGGVWTQLGPKLVGSGTIGTGGMIGAGGETGMSASLSADGNTALLGRPGDNSNAGAVWVFTTSTPSRRRDFNWDGRSDLVWQHTDGSAALWLMDGLTPTSGVVVLDPATGWHVIQTGDFNADGKTDLVWQHTDGRAAIWLMDGLTPTSGVVVLAPATGWQLIQTGDFNSDGKSDLVWQHTDGRAAIWLMDGLTPTSGVVVLAAATGWQLIQTGDFNDDGKTDLVWQHTDGRAAIWLMDGLTPTSGVVVLDPATGWHVIQTGDFNADDKTDLVWQHTDGSTAIWLMDGLTPTSGVVVLDPATGWQAIQTGDFNGDRKTDLVWQHTDGSTALWLMDGLTPTSGVVVLDPTTGWRVHHVGDFNGDGKSDLVWHHPTGSAALWLMDGLTPTSAAIVLDPATGWSPLP